MLIEPNVITDSGRHHTFTIPLVWNVEIEGGSLSLQTDLLLSIKNQHISYKSQQPAAISTTATPRSVCFITTNDSCCQASVQTPLKGGPCNLASQSPPRAPVKVQTRQRGKIKSVRYNVPSQEVLQLNTSDSDAKFDFPIQSDSKPFVASSSGVNTVGTPPNGEGSSSEEKVVYTPETNPFSIPCTGSSEDHHESSGKLGGGRFILGETFVGGHIEGHVCKSTQSDPLRRQEQSQGSDWQQDASPRKEERGRWERIWWRAFRRKWVKVDNNNLALGIPKPLNNTLEISILFKDGVCGMALFVKGGWFVGSAIIARDTNLELGFNKFLDIFIHSKFLDHADSIVIDLPAKYNYTKQFWNHLSYLAHDYPLNIISGPSLRRFHLDRVFAKCHC